VECRGSLTGSEGPFFIGKGLRRTNRECVTRSNKKKKSPGKRKPPGGGETVDFKQYPDFDRGERGVGGGGLPNKFAHMKDRTTCK